MAILLAVFWGGFGAEHKYIAVAATMAWGPGDAVATIVGKTHGKHKLQGERIEGVKSVEGSVGMALTSFVCTLPVLLTMSGLPWYICVLFAALVAPIASLTELYTKKGFGYRHGPLRFRAAFELYDVVDMTGKGNPQKHPRTAGTSLFHKHQDPRFITNRGSMRIKKRHNHLLKMVVSWNHEPF